VTKLRYEAAAAARLAAGLGQRKRAELLGLLRPAFARTEPWLQAGKYLGAVMSDLPKRNGWTIARFAGDRSPDRTQRLLNRAAWDTFAAMGVVRRFAVAGLDEAAGRLGRRRGLAVGALDETGQEKQGRASGSQDEYLQEQGQGHVLRVPSNFRVTLARGVTLTCAEATRRLLAGDRRWEVRSAGEGVQRRPLVRPGLARHRLPAPLPADPPPHPDR
jgi:hypothetical protein